MWPRDTELDCASCLASELPSIPWNHECIKVQGYTVVYAVWCFNDRATPRVWTCIATTTWTIIRAKLVDWSLRGSGTDYCAKYSPVHVTLSEHCVNQPQQQTTWPMSRGLIVRMRNTGVVSDRVLHLYRHSSLVHIAWCDPSSQVGQVNRCNLNHQSMYAASIQMETIMLHRVKHNKWKLSC